MIQSFIIIMMIKEDKNNDITSDFYTHTGDNLHTIIPEESIGDEMIYAECKNKEELTVEQRTESELLQEEQQLLEDLFRTATKEFSNSYKALLKQKDKLNPQEYGNILKEEKQLLAAIRDLNHVLGLVRQKRGGYAWSKWDQFAGFNQKAQHEGQKYGLSIDGFSDLEYIDEKNDNFYQVNYFNNVNKSKDLQLVPMGWPAHETFMILDHINHKIIIYDPNGDFYNLFKKSARLDKIDKDNVMKFLLGKDNAEQLKDYDLFDANGVWGKETGIQGLSVYRPLNTGKRNLQPGETDGACAFSSRYWAETFLKDYFKHIKRNKTKAIENYNGFLSQLNREMKNTGLYHATNLRHILKAGFESFYYCDLIKKSLFSQQNQSSSRIRNHFPATIAKFQHLIEHYKYREHNSKVRHWEDAVRRVQQMRRYEVLERNEEKLAPTRKIMEEGFYETYGNYGNNRDNRINGCEYLNEMKKNPIFYNKRRIPHLGNKSNDVNENDLNASDLKGRINGNRYKKITRKRRGNLNLDELSNNHRRLNYSVI